jgi:hypothetical protein
MLYEQHPFTSTYILTSSRVRHKIEQNILVVVSIKYIPPMLFERHPFTSTYILTSSSSSRTRVIRGFLK